MLYSTKFFGFMPTQTFLHRKNKEKLPRDNPLPIWLGPCLPVGLPIERTACLCHWTSNSCYSASNLLQCSMYRTSKYHISYHNIPLHHTIGCLFGGITFFVVFSSFFPRESLERGERVFVSRDMMPLYKQLFYGMMCLYDDVSLFVLPV